MAGKTSDANGNGRLTPARRSAIDSFIVMDVMRAAAGREAAGAQIIHMEVGQPGTPAPRAARLAAARALESDTLGYTLALGLPELREKIAGLYKQWYGLSLAPERVIVTTGSSGAFVLAFLALFDAGASIGLASPGYPCYRHILKTLDCKSVILETDAASGWTLDARAIARAGRLDGLLLASPGNPTGTMMAPERLGQIALACAAQGIPFISDEIYHGLTYTGPAATALQFSDEAIVINSFSKYFSMTGWRVGWMVVPEHLVRVVERLAQNLFIAAPSISQIAAIGAFDGFDELEANKRVYATNRELLLNELPRAGFEKMAPADGAFYLYCDVSGMTDDSPALARRILAETGVAVTPGVDFDAVRGKHFLRFSYSAKTDAMHEAARRLIDWRQRA
ncbi:MAG: aminotransferase class I/II-fold pyridoxal phosphate-dependent enzyme [Hyphomicrobium sp.]